MAGTQFGFKESIGSIGSKMFCLQRCRDIKRDVLISFIVLSKSDNLKNEKLVEFLKYLDLDSKNIRTGTNLYISL